MAYSRQTYVNQLREWIGRNEYDGTHKEIIDIYNAHRPLARNYKVKYTDSWCATTVSAAAINVGYTDIIPLECSCGKMIQLAQQMGIWQENDTYIPNPGDIIMYDWDDSGSGDDTGWPEHVGVVEECDGSTITVIEGNYKDAVGRRNIAVNGKYIRGFICPKFDSNEEEKKEMRFQLLQNMNMRSISNGNLVTTVPQGTIISGTELKSTGSTQWLYTDYNGNKGYVAVLPESKGYAKQLAEPSFTCIVDACDETGFAGWCYDGISDKEYELHCYLTGANGKSVGYNGIMANIYRADLEAAGIGNGKHGFNWEHNLYADLGEGEFIYNLYAITDDGSNPCVAEGKVTIKKIVEPEPIPEPTPEPEPIPEPTPEEPSDVEKLQAEVDKLYAIVEENTKTINLLTDRVSSIENDVKNLEKQVDVNNSNDGTLATTVSNLILDVDTCKTTLNKIKNIFVE